MKRYPKKILSFLIAALLFCAALTGCDFSIGGSKKALRPPEVVIDAEGVATWDEIGNASHYLYTIDDGEATQTEERSVRLSDGQTIRVKAVSGSEEYQDSPYSEPKTYLKSEHQTKLSPPTVALGADGLAVWNSDPHASYYIYTIDGGEELLTDVCSVQLSDGQTIRVKAVSVEDDYLDSDFSAPMTYHAGSVQDHDHSDVNSDGICDICKESVIEELSFYAVNDLHGKFKDTSTQPGVDEFSTYLKNLYADPAREEILLSSGDMWQGTVESSDNRGKLMTEWMNDVGFCAMTLGNHEFDWGSSVLTPNSELADFPFLAINVTYNGAPVDYCRASTVVERGGVKIGIIGAIGDCLSSISGEFTEGLSFATGSRLTALVKAEATRLREEEGCGFIVYSIHDGGSDFSSYGVNSVTNSDMGWYDSSLSNGYVDLVFEGHTHQRYILKDEYGVYHLQGASENKFLSCADVSFNTVTHEYTVEPKHISSDTYANSSLDDDPIVEELFEKYFPDGDPYDVLGYNRTRRYSSDIISKVAELYFEKGVEVWGNRDDVASAGGIVCGGGFLNARNPYNIYAGNVTYADIAAVLPFDNEIVLGKIRGSDLTSFLNRRNDEEHPYTIYTTISSSEIESNKYYYIIVDSYTSSYRSNRITEVARLGEGTYARDLLAEFIKGGGWA